MPWKKCIGVGRAYELLRADVLEHLEKIQRDIGFESCRFHGVFHDEMGVVRRRADGRLHFSWHHLDKVYDNLLKLKLRPFVELGSMPTAIASGDKTIFDWNMNITPPACMKDWGELVEAFALHLVERYGVTEVRHWHFEVWNEPNLEGFWSGTKEQYWDLYRVSAAALKKVDRLLKIGGPATSKGEWVDEMIEWTSRESVPLDFVSTHLYPQDEWVLFPDGQSPYEQGTFFGTVVSDLKKRVAASKRPDMPIHWTEFNSLAAVGPSQVEWVDNPQVDNLFSCSFIARQGVELDAMADSFSWWTASDVFEEASIPHSPFSGTYGLLTIHGIPKSSYHAFRLLGEMQGSVMKCFVKNAPIGCGLCVTRVDEPSGARWRALLWNNGPLGSNKSEPWLEKLELDFLPESSYKVIAERIGPGKGSCYETWLRMGRPQNLSRSEERLLCAHATPESNVYLLPDGRREPFEIHLGPHEVLFIEFSSVTPMSGPKGISSHASLWNEAMGGQSR